MKKVKILIISVIAFVVSLVWAFVSTPNTYADTDIVIQRTDIISHTSIDTGAGSYNGWSWSGLYGPAVEYGNFKTANNTTFSLHYTGTNVGKVIRAYAKFYLSSCPIGTIDICRGSVRIASQNAVDDQYNEISTDLTAGASDIVFKLVYGSYPEDYYYYIEKNKDFYFGLELLQTSPVNIANGTGVKSVYLSTNQTAKSGSASGTEFDIGSTVYGFAELAKGYSAPSGWTLVSGTANTEGAKYRVSSVKAGNSNFGTISAALITYNITYNLAGGTHGSTHPATYNVTTNTFTISNPTKTGYTFKGWTGSNGNTSQTGVSIAKGSIGDKTYTANWTLLPVIQDVVDKINAIGTVQYPESKGLINTARSAYDALDPSYKSIIVSNYQTLTTAETTYGNLRTGAINNVKDLIDDIGTVTYPTSKAAIEAAEAAYAALDSDEKNTTAITNYATLTGARTEYDAQRDAAVQAVIAAVAAIGEVTYPNSKEAIVNAETLYNALDEDEKNTTVITNYATLTGDRTAFDDLRAAAIQAVIDKIDAIAIPLVYPNSNSDLTTARTAFDALHNDDKNDTVITNYPDLLDVEAAYSVVKEVNEIGNSEDTQEFRDKVLAVRNNYNDLTNTQKSLFPDSEYNDLVKYETGISVMDLINAIGNVVITPASKALIDTANEAYEALTDAQKELVANYGKLVQANTDYDKALEVVNKIDAIGEGEYSKEKQALITDARYSYNMLTPYQQSIVYNYQKLLDAEIAATEALIDNIGNIKYTSESKALIDKARASYDALEADQKALVENYATLTKDEADYSAVDKVVKDINNIGNITYDQASDNKIKACRKLDNELTNDQKAILPQETENKLVSYEKAYSALVKINSIGSVEYSEETEELIKDAREAYDGLSPDQKKLINNDDYSVLSTKEEELDSKTSTAIAWGVILVILASLTLCAGLLSIWFLLFKKDNDDDENNKKPQTTKAASSILPLVILASHFGTGPYRAFYIILIIAALAWIAVLVIYILKKKGIIMTKKTKKEEAIVEEANDKEEKEEIIEEENEIIEIRTDNK